MNYLKRFNSKQIKIGLCIFVLLILAIYSQHNAEKLGKKHFNEFNKANIKGVIQEVSIVAKGDAFKMYGFREIYVFYPYTDEQLNKSSIFQHTAKRGDSIIKPPNSDTLYLIKDKKILKYTFYKL